MRTKPAVSSGEFRDWLTAHIDELDGLYDHPDPHERVWERCASIAESAGDIAARIGLPKLHEQSRSLVGMADPQPVKTFLSECLLACPAPNAAPANYPPLMTADETMAYLRLNVDERDPAERLRNLVRRQRLPDIRRGKLQLFRRSAVDAWLERRK
jgi:hypothetical protein